MKNNRSYLFLKKEYPVRSVYTVHHYGKMYMKRKKVCNSYARIGLFFEEVG